MSKRSKWRNKKSKNKSMTSIIIGAAIITIVLIFFASGGFGSVPDVAQARLDLDPMKGNPDAPVTITEYASYGCQACFSWHKMGIIDEILKEFDGQVNFIFRDFPIISPAYDRRAASVAQCALDQSQDAFWTYHSAVYETYDITRSTDELMDLGRQIGLDMEALESCVDNNTHAKTISYDEKRGHELGLRGVPAFLVNDQVVYMADPDTLRQAIRQALLATS